MRKTQGFTLLEILLVVGIISLLAGIVIIAINPSKQLATTRDMQRKHDIGEINKAITQYYIDHNGYPAVLSAALTPICNSGTDTSPSCSAGTLDLSALIPDYLTAIPYDPSASTATTTGYSLATNTGGNLYLSAANAELATITLGSSAGVTGAEVGGEESNCEAGGGSLTTDGSDNICTFTSSGTFVVPDNSTVEVLVVGGGGGGGFDGGGGGAGGLIYRSNYSVAAGTYTVTVGSGGSGGQEFIESGNGDNSVFDSLIAEGGGGGGRWYNGPGSSEVGLNGGSGGGSSGRYSEPGTIVPGGLAIQPDSESGGFGNSGGGGMHQSGWYVAGGGGGGAGGAGSDYSDTIGGDGGPGSMYSISGSEVYYAGGGGGGVGVAGSTGTGGSGGIGGGGSGADLDSGVDGTSNTGGGGGGSGWDGNAGNVGGDGGSGIVIIRYTTI